MRPLPTFWLRMTIGGWNMDGRVGASALEGGDGLRVRREAQDGRVRRDLRHVRVDRGALRDRNGQVLAVEIVPGLHIEAVLDEHSQSVIEERTLGKVRG